MGALLAVSALTIGIAKGRPQAIPELTQRLFPHETAWNLMVLNSRTDCLFGVDWTGDLDRFDYRSGRVDHWGKRGAAVRALALNPAGQTLATGSTDGSIILRDAATGAVQCQVPPPGLSGASGSRSVTSLAYHPDGRTLAVGSADGTLRFLDASSGQLVREVPGPSKAVTHLAFDPSGQSLIMARSDGTVALGDATTGQTERVIWSNEAQVRRLALSPDGRTLALALAPLWAKSLGELVIIDLSDPAAPARTLARTQQDALSFTPDGRGLVAAGSDSIVHQWDVVRGRQVAQGVGHQGFINQVIVTPDGLRAITSGEDGLLGLFDLRGPDLPS